jgi:hypothetical protein
MISNLFPKNPVFMCFGGGGSGGSSSGAASSGGGSRADKKGAAAVFSAPKPVYTAPTNATTHNDNNNRRDRTPVAPVVNYGALPSTPPPSVVTPPMRGINPSPAPSVIDGLSNLRNIQFVGKDRPYLEYAGSDGPEPSELTSPPFKTPSPVYMQQDNTGGNARTLQLQQDDYDISRRYIDSLNKKSSQTPRFRPKDLSIDPLSMESDKGTLGQVSKYGLYAGDGFEWQDSGQGFQSRIYTGAPGTMNGLGTDILNAIEIAHGDQQDRENFRRIGETSFKEGGDFALSPGSANDGDLWKFLTKGDFERSDSYVDQYGLRNSKPVVEGEQVGALSSVASGNAPQFATTKADYTGLERTYNTWGEDLANAFSINDGASYVRGQLIDDATGLPLKPGDKASSTGKVIRGTFDNKKNNLEGFGGLGAAPILNTGREYLANILVPNDNAAYVDGQLIDTITGKSLEGGGYTTDPVTKQKDYVYGVSDDYSNNLQRDTTGMSDIEARAEIANQVMQRDIPPSDLAYFTSFLPGMTVPLIGGYLGEKMLEGGIKGRRAVIDEQTAALKAGATPIYNEKGEYVGYNDGTTTVDYNPSSYRGSSKDRIDQDSTSIFSQAKEDRMSASDDNNTTNDRSRSDVANDIFSRYYKGGSGVGLPDWLRRYASGIRIDELLSKETLDDGTVMYKTPDGKYIEEKYLTGARMSAE